MRKRDVVIRFHLDKSEAEFLDKDVKKAGLSREAYLRGLIKKHPMKAREPEEYFKILKNLRQINNNMNQIALKANALGLIDEPEYRKNIRMLQTTVGLIKKLSG